MRIVESFLTRNPCYAAGRKITVKGLMLHSVGCPQPRASAFVRSWDSPAHGGSCVHGFIDGEDGTVYQTLPWNHRGWHCGSGNRGSGNNTHIGVEMCESACIRYTAGSNFTCLDVDAARAVAERTYRAAVGLFAMLCGKYGLDPLEDGVVISHREGCARGIASNHGDPEHLWGQLGMGYTMDGFRREVRAAMEGAASGVDGCMRIMGKAVATAGQMAAYVRARNPGVVQSVLDMIPLYLSEGEAEGVRGDIAFAQSCLETGNFTFSGSAVTLLQNNFCGMGVTGKGMRGNSFGTPLLGIRAQVQHLKAYASRKGLVKECVDPRFRYVERGCAEYVEWLGQKENPAGKGWAAGAGYGEKILAILEGILGMAGGEPSAGGAGGWYRVRKSWADAGSQKGAFKELGNAKECADGNPGYLVFDWNGNVVYGKADGGGMTDAACPFMVWVWVADLNIREGAGTDTPRTGRYTGKGCFTIVQVKAGEGSDAGWGKLKSGAGWIALDFCEKI